MVRALRVQGGAMTIAPDLIARILRLHAAEKWRVGTIARQLQVHRDTVRRVLAVNGLAVQPSLLRPSRIDAYRPFILDDADQIPHASTSTSVDGGGNHSDAGGGARSASRRSYLMYLCSPDRRHQKS